MRWPRVSSVMVCLCRFLMRRLIVCIGFFETSTIGDEPIQIEFVWNWLKNNLFAQTMHLLYIEIILEFIKTSLVVEMRSRNTMSNQRKLLLSRARWRRIMRPFVLVEFFNHVGKIRRFLFRWWFGRCILGPNSHRWRCNVVHEVEFEVLAWPKI